MLRHLIAAFFKRLILPSGSGCRSGLARSKATSFLDSNRISISHSLAARSSFITVSCVCGHEGFRHRRSRICAAAADTAVKTHITETLFHILKTAPGIDEHQIPVCPRRPYSIDGTLWNEPSISEVSVPSISKKAIFFMNNLHVTDL